MTVTTAAIPDQRFGAGLLRLLGGGAANAVCSPASVAAALRMALLGARGDTAVQLASALRLHAGAGPAHAPAADEAAPGVPAGAGGSAARAAPKASGQALALPGLRLREESLAGLSAGPALLRAPAALWLQSGMTLRAAFQEALAGLSVAARQTDFRAAPDRARRDVNAMISEQTAGQVAELLPAGAVSRDTRLVLANAVYLKAAWARPFPPGATADGPFQTGSGRRARTPMMRVTARLNYLRGDGYQVVVLPFEGGGLALTIVVPDGAWQPVEDEVAAAGLPALTSGAAPAQVRLILPKFRLRTRSDLGPALRGLGVTAAFGSAADFGGIAAARPLSVGPVAHMAFIDVDEHGVEAAAATGLAMVALSAVAVELEVRVDRPFLFAITDTQHGIPFFLGRVTDPVA